MYTEFHFNASLKRDVPPVVVATLQLMVDQPTGMDWPEPQADEPLLQHRLFTSTRWHYMLACDSYYFDADTHSTLRFDDIWKCYYLCIRTNLKNYEGEIEAFIDWIMPYLDKEDGNFLGFSRYEETETPTLIYYHAS
jgi:hypothetical protein